MPQVDTIYAIPAAGGQPTVIRCTRVTSRMEIVENPGYQGLIAQDYTSKGQSKLSSYTIGPAYDVQPDQEPLVFAGYPGDHPPNTVPIGTGGSSPDPVGPGGPVTHGTPICQLTSLTATATSVRVTEYF